MTRRPVDIARWSADDDLRAAEVAEIVQSAGFRVHRIEQAPDAPKLLLLLPGSGDDNLVSKCLELAQTYPDSPSVADLNNVAGVVNKNTAISAYVHAAASYSGLTVRMVAVDADGTMEKSNQFAISSGWQRRSDQLYSLAAAVSAKLVDVKQ